MTGNKRAIKSDLTKVDAHAVQPHEYDEAPEISDEQLARAEVTVGVRPRGRPKAAVTKVPVSLRLDSDIVAAYKAIGEGWQTQINSDLRNIRKLGPAPASVRDAQRNYVEVASHTPLKNLKVRIRNISAGAVTIVRHRDLGDTKIGTLRKTYGAHFAEGIKPDMRLADVVSELDGRSLTRLRQKSPKELAALIKRRPREKHAG